MRFVFAALALLLVAIGGVATAAPAAAAAGAPVVIDDFSGGVLGTRTVTPLNGSSTFSQSGGVGTIVANAPYADSGGIQLDYALPSATDLTSHGNNTQFFLQFNSILRSPADDTNLAAQIGIVLTDSAGHTGSYSTGISSVSPFNIVLNFNCSGGTCFSGSVDFTKITHVQALIMTPGNYDTHTLTAVLDMIRTTPTGGAVPTPPTPTVTTPATSVASLNNTSVNFGITYTIDGSAAGPDAAGLTISNIVVSGTAGGISGVTLTGSSGNYTVTVGPLTSTGTVSVHVNAGAVTDGWGQGSDPSSGEPVVTFTKEVVPTISVATAATATVGTAFSLAATATGVPAPSFTVSAGTLPAGLTLSSAGTIHGTPAVGSGGVYALTIKATNAVGNSTGPLALTVNETPGFTSAASTSMSEDVAGSFTVTTRGYPAPTISETVGAALPSGVTFTANANGTATIAGTPALGTNGSYTVPLIASNGIGIAAGQSFVLTTTSAPVITANAQDQTVAPGATVTFTAAATSTPSPTVKWQRTDDAGTYVDIIGATSTSYSFVAATTDSGHMYRAVFSNGVGQQAMTAATLTVRLAPSITSTSTASFVVGTTGTVAITTTGFPFAALTLTGAPAWLTLHDNGDGTGSLTGVAPTAAAGATLSLTITASNGVTTDAIQQFSLIVKQAPSVSTNPQNTVVTPGSTVTLSAAATGFPVPTVQWQSSVNAGLSFQNVSGATSVNYVFVAALGNNGSQYRAVFTNQVGNATTAAATLRVGIAPVFTSAASATFDAGVSGSVTVQTSGAPTAAITAGTRPAWLTFHDNGDGTATLTGLPSATDAGNYTVSLSATNTFDPDAQQTFTLTVDAAPIITSASTTSFNVGEFGSFDLATVVGFPSSTAISESGPLPSGVTLEDNGDGTASLSGTPDVGTGGDYQFTVTAAAVDGDAMSTRQSFDLIVNEAPSFSGPNSTTFEVGIPSSFTVGALAGYPTLQAMTETGALPTGLTFQDNGDGTAALGGTAAVGSGGTYPVVVSSASDNGRGLGSDENFTVTVLEAPTFTSDDSETLDVSTPSSFSVTTLAGYPTATSLAESGALPAGMTFVDNGDGTATLDGTASLGAGGDYPLTFTATSFGVDGLSQSQTFDLVVRESPAFTSDDAVTFENGVLDAFTIVTSHDFPTATSLNEVGNLPTGVSFVDNGNGTASLRGTPSVPGSYPLTFTASNRVPVQVTQSFTLTVATPPTLPTNLDSSFVAGVTSSVTLTSTPGVPAATVISEAGALPDGITLTDNGDGTATLSGSATPDSVGSYPVTFIVGNGVSPDTDYAATITITAADPVTLPTSVPQPAGGVGGVPGQSTQGDVLTVGGSGFAPGAPITIGIYSTPTFLGSAVADETGSFSAQVTLPALLGLHTVVVSGIDPSGDPRFLASQTTITAKRSVLQTTGVEIGGGLYLAFALFASGLLVILFAYRRRVTARAPR
jgi:Putative Ig domain